MVHVKSAIIVAAFAAAPALAAPLSTDETELYSRDLSEELFVRSGRVPSRAGTWVIEKALGTAETLGENKIKDTLKGIVSPPVQIPPGLAEAGRKATGGFSNAAVDAIIKPGGKKRRDLKGLYARSGRVPSRAGTWVIEKAIGTAETLGENKIKDTLKGIVSPPVQIPPGLAEAGRKATGGFSNAAVDAIIKPGGKKRRDLEELYRRTGRGISRAGTWAIGKAANAAEAITENKITSTVKEIVFPPVQIPPGLAEAGRKATGGFSNAAVDAITKPGGKKRRDFEDFEARDFGDFDVYERDYEDFEDVFERDFDDLTERYFDDLEEREFYELNELD
ncbi:hypothetical protein BDQ17DRAFT_1420064 [Cyathus striatus]|nr:hypothetical protein BDQ17DRAFT_1420064 [Cyathus striatus]